MSRTSRRHFAKTLTAAGAALPLLAQTSSPPREYAEHLDAAELARVAATLRDQAALVERLRAFPLKNSDEPDFTFAALTKRW